MVLFLETCTAEVSSGRVFFLRRQAFSGRGSGPQGLRRPRFSFFRFTCQTARKPWRFPFPMAGKSSKPKSSDRNRTTGHLISEELRRRAIAPESGAARRCGGFIWATPSPCQHQIRANFAARFVLWRASVEARLQRASTRSAPHSRHIPPALF